jgi:phospholipid/cholesterol/gamma-HCH transport system substrate-binding protein
MTVAIRKHLRDFIAISVLVVAALIATYIIVQQQRLRIPILEEKPFTLKAEFETAQAVVPGQGQTIRVAGVRIGDVQDVQLEHGTGVVTFAIDRKYLPVYRNATIMLRPSTGLKDMFFELDPGTKAAGEVPNGGTIPLANTAPDVNLDEILSALDADTQAYLRVLLVGAGQGLKGQAKNLGRVLGSVGPINSDLERINTLVAQRRHELSDLIHNLNVLTAEIGTHRGDVVSFVKASNDALSAIAPEDLDVRRAVRYLPGTLDAAARAFHQVNGFAQEAGPTFTSLIPFARKLDELNASVRELAGSATPVLKNQVRPFVRSARPAIPPLNTAAQRYAKASPKLTVLGKEINRLGNMAAYNPGGAEPPQDPVPEACSGVNPDLTSPNCRDEGYLYWAAWLSHNGNSVEQSGDSIGNFRRIYFTLTCGNLNSIVQQSHDQLKNVLIAQGVPVDPALDQLITDTVKNIFGFSALGGTCT